MTIINPTQTTAKCNQTIIKVQAQLIQLQVTKNYTGQVVIPYTQGTAKGFKNICGKYGILVHFKGNTTIKQATYEAKGPRPQGKEKWNYLQLPVYQHSM